ncbi:MAG: DUF3108 domain-containing protein [Methylotenera sp.]|nr:DUF3108 domain-containing protein [Methylotenera sp.]MSP99549.1 DUF3108 domain-containing protein [Methylotenera sp.]
MLSKWKLAWQQLSNKHIAIALASSLLLHLWLMGALHVNSPALTAKKSVLEARLVLPKKTSKPSSVPMASKLLDQAKPAVKPIALPELPIIDNLPVNVVTEIRQDNAIASAGDEDDATDQHRAGNEAESIGYIVNPNPYQYIESEFDLYIGKEPALSSSPAGKAKIIYQLLPSAAQYHIESLMQAKGLAALITLDLLQTSSGYVNRSGLQPQHYLYQFGNKKNKTFTADFDWESKKIKLQSEAGQQKLDLADGSQDLLSFMYQFMYVAPMQSMQLSITNGKKIAIYVYSFEGEEVISSKMGDLRTVHLARTADESEKKTELWLSLDYQYVPVKIRESEENGKVYELVINSLKTDNPLLLPQ